jgi:SPP1 gp7 family putative phage head morphogenesis protein
MAEKSWDAIVEEVAQELYNGKLQGTISPAMVSANAKKILQAVAIGYNKRFDIDNLGTDDEIQLEALRNEVYVFSGFKNYQQLKECSSLLLDSNGKIRPFKDFLNDVKTIDKTYNVHYLEAEYQHAQASSTMMSKWNDIKAQADTLPFLQYDAVNDDRTREEHRLINGVIKRWDDSFWRTYYPPNGWNCRCEVRQLAKATVSKNVDEPVIQPMFRNNVGIDGLIFPDTHPYYDVKAPKVKKAIAKEALDVSVKDNYKTLSTNPEYVNYKKDLVKKGFDLTHPELNQDEATTIYGYSNSSYHNINAFLRQTGKVFDDVQTKYLQAFNQVLNTALDKIKTPFKGVVYRGTGLTEKQLAKYVKGKTITEFGFTSTSYSRDEAFAGNTIFIIKSKSGKLIAEISGHKTEQEVLFKSGTKFKVIDVTQEGGKTIIEMNQL